MANDLVRYLLSGDSSLFYGWKQGTSNYNILYVLANYVDETKYEHEVGAYIERAQNILAKASLKLPINLDLEAEQLYMEVLLALFNK